MYHHVVGAEKVTGNSRPHHSHHLVSDGIVAIVTAMLLADCAFESNDGGQFAFNRAPYFANCLEEEFGCD